MRLRAGAVRKRRVCALSIATLLAILPVVPAAAEVLSSDSSGFVVRTVVDVAASPDRAWKRLVTPSLWWSSQHSWSGSAKNLSMTPRAGGCFCERLPKGSRGSGGDVRRATGSVVHATVVHADPGRLLRLSGALGPLQDEALTGTLTIELAPQGNGRTRATFTYAVSGRASFPLAAVTPAVDKVIAEQANNFAR